MPKTITCGAPHKATEFSYDGNVQNDIIIHFESSDVLLSSKFIQAILNEFRGKTILGGFKMDDPPVGGFGEWVQNNSKRLNGIKLSPRHASFVAAVLRNEKLLNCRLDKNAIILDFNA